MTERIDGHLSRIAQRIDPAALVVVVDPLRLSQCVWTLRRPGLPDLALGTRVPSSYGDALDALHAWVRAEKAKGRTYISGGQSK